MSDSPSDSEQPRSKKPRREPKPSVTQQYEALRSQQRAGTSFYWQRFTVVMNGEGEDARVQLKCLCCNRFLSATNPSKTAREHWAENKEQCVKSKRLPLGVASASNARKITDFSAPKEVASLMIQDMASFVFSSPQVCIARLCAASAILHVCVYQLTKPPPFCRLRCWQWSIQT
jgi:hypothetical protein